MPTTHHEPLGGLSPSACVHDPVCLDRYGYLDYLPSLPANIFLLSIFSLYFLIHLVLFTLKYRFTWTYLLANFLGLSLEIIGYVGRVFLHYHVFDQTYFIIYLIGLTIAPAFLSAAIYVSLSRIIPIYTSPNSTKPLTLLPAKTITVSFIACDVVSLILQAVGGALAALAVNDDKSTTSGVRIMIAGLTTQVVATTAFCIVCGHLMWSVRAHPERVNTDTTSFRRSNRFRGWLIALGIATTAILIRCVFRVAELSGGFKSKLANDEPKLLVFDGAMMLIAAGCLCFMHPGWVLGRERWVAGGMGGGAKKAAAVVGMGESGGGEEVKVKDVEEGGSEVSQASVRGGEREKEEAEVEVNSVGHIRTGGIYNEDVVV